MPPTPSRGDADEQEQACWAALKAQEDDRRMDEACAWCDYGIPGARCTCTASVPLAAASTGEDA